MSIEKGIITAITFNRNHTVAKLRLGTIKWAYVSTTNDLTGLLGGQITFTGEWHSTLKGKYFLVSDMEAGSHPSLDKTLEKVNKLIFKKGVKPDPLRMEYNQLLRTTLGLLYLMGRKQVIINFLKLPVKNQDKYLSNPYQFYLQKRLDYYSAETLSTLNHCPQDVGSRIIAHAQHVVNLAYEGGKEIISIETAASELSRRINMPEDGIMDILNSPALRGGFADVKRVNDNLMLGWIYWLREKSLNLMLNNPTIERPPIDIEDNIAELLSRKMCVLSGGAGTGKTTLLKKLKDTGLRVEYSALTGKAASVLGTEARTVHNLLGYRGGKFTVERLDCDILVVDEASMLNWHTLYAILKASPRTIFAGDPAQLPPVEGDAVFQRIMAVLPVIELTKSWRFADSAVPNICEIVCADNSELILNVRRMAKSLASQGSIQVITPVNTGLLGVGNLNIILRPVINTTKSEPLLGIYRSGDKVICSRNVYCDRIIIAANGQVGTVTGREGGMLWVDFSGRPVLVEEETLNFAYAQTVHKCQGSEYNNVIFIIPEGLDSEFLTENLLLVGKTRGRNMTYVLRVGGKKEINEMASA